MVALLALSLMNNAHATNVMADCSTGDAPTGWDTMDCDTPGEGDVCIWDEHSEGDGWVTCDGTKLADGIGESVSMYAVYDFDGNGKYSMWGTSSGPIGQEKFCCVLDDVDDALYVLYLKGTGSGDYLSLNYDSGSENMANASAREVRGEVWGQGGNDNIHGSYTWNSYYEETLLGGSGDDIMNGYFGDEIMQGNDGYDQMVGGYGNDLLCDDQDSDYFDAGHGDDTIWYGTSSSLPPDAASTANPVAPSFGTDRCGDQNGPDFAVSDYIDNCGILIITQPTECPAW